MFSAVFGVVGKVHFSYNFLFYKEKILTADETLSHKITLPHTMAEMLREARKVEFKAEKEYPSLDGIAEDFKTLRLISPAYAGGKGELTAVLQYVYQSVLLEKLGKAEMSKKILGIAINEMRHLELLGSAITRLGAPPAFTACLPYPVGFYSASSVNYVKTPVGMLEADIEAETNAIAEYRRILTCISDGAVAALVERIVGDEEGHLSAFRSMKEELD